jgi:hypothetical protein
VIYGLFESVSDDALAMLAHEARRLETFMGGELLALNTHTPFTRSLK